MNRILVSVSVACILATAACSNSNPATTTTAADPMSNVTQVSSTAAGSSADDDLPGVTSFEGLTRDHVDTAEQYPQSPPVGGDHSGIWQNCGVYDAPIANENAVHSLEHGAVWLAYRPDLTDADVAIIRKLASGHTHVLVSPYTGLTEAVVATAWGKQLRLDTVDGSVLAEFVAHYEQGQQTPELGVTCGGALGDPIE